MNMIRWSVKGFGVPMASVFLALYLPDRFTIADSRALETLRAWRGYPAEACSFTTAGWVRYLAECRAILAECGGARSVGRRLILGTNILIAYERGTIDRSSLDDDELAVASVSVAEYRVGIEMAATASRAAERARALVAIISAVDVLDYTQATAAHHGRLLAHVRRSGSPRGAHDLIIAAHAAQTGRTILSRDAKARFGDLPGVTAIDA